MPAPRALLGLLLGGQQLLCKLRDANVERTCPRSLRKATLPAVKRYIHTRAVPFALTVTGHGSEVVQCQLQEASCLQEVHADSGWSLGMCTLKKNILLPHFRCTTVPL